MKIVTAGQRGSVATGDGIRGVRNNIKIVTAGHRGSVATDEVIREMRHNKCRLYKRRLFSYSLILLFSLCRGGEAANGAKLCKFGWNGAFGNTYASNISDGSWAIGAKNANCCTQGQGADLNSNCVTTGTYVGSGAFPSSFCTGVAVGGVAGSGPAPTSNTASWTIETTNNPIAPARGVSGSHCWCKLTYPVEGKLVYISQTANGCAKQCGQAIFHTSGGVYKSSLLDVLVATIGWGN